ncbi:MAG: SDR family oxidoreductase [Bacteroidota bacterium]
MRILVTGHNGYIGTILTPMLLGLGHEVKGLDSNLYDSCFFEQFPPPTIPATVKDVRDVELVDVLGFDTVIHLAGLSNDPLGYFNPELTFEINHLASIRLAELCKKAGVKRFLYASSCSNYGAAGDNLISETGVLNPITPYAVSKMRAEQEIGKLADDTFSPIFLRNATVYGFSPRIRFDLVINNLVAWAYTTRKIYLKSDGHSWRPLVHVADVAQAFVKLMEAPLEVVHNEIFNVGDTRENYRIADLVEIIAAIIPDATIEYAEDAGPDKRNYRVNCDKIQRVIPSFKPAWNVEKGVQELYQIYQNVHLQAGIFESATFKRIAHIQQLIRLRKLDGNLRNVVLA